MVYKNFRKFGSVLAPSKGNRTVRTAQNAEIASEIAAAALTSGQSLSTRRIGAQMGISSSSAWRILRKDLGFKPYHIRLIHKLNEDDFDRRVDLLKCYFKE